MTNIDKTVKSKYPPKQKNVNWIDTSGDKPEMKTFFNGKWTKTGGSGSSSFVVADSDNMPDSLKPNTVYNFGELDSDIEFPEFDSNGEYCTYTIVFDSADDIDISFQQPIIWQNDSPEQTTSGNHYEIHINSVGDKFYGYYTEWDLPAEANCLTFTAEEDNSSIGFYYWVGPHPGTCPDLGKNMEYSLDNGKTWETYTIVNAYNDINYINLEHVGDSVMFRGNNETLRGEGDNSTKCELQGKVAASGDITSLLNGIGGDIPIPESCFALFFFHEEGLTSAPNLPSTRLAEGCYSSMFSGCTSLTTAPALPATTLVSNCYQAMFSSCTSLNEVTCLATDISAGNCTSSWLYGVSQTGTFTKAAGMNDWTTGDSGIPEGWTVESL